VIKHVIDLYIDGLSYDKITSSVNNKFDANYNQKQISDFITSIQKESLEKKASFRKLIELFDSQKIPRLKLFFLTNYYVFYFSFILLFVINLYASNKLTGSNLNFTENIIIYLILVFIFILHEIGHSIFAKLYNITSGKIGIGLYSIFPIFYINLNEIWRLKKSKRVLINLGGIYFQLILGVFFVLIYLFTNSPILIKLLNINIGITIINLNPFLKFDGYWILSDCLNDKYLYQKSTIVIKKWLKIEKHKYSKLITIYSIGRLFFLFLIFYILGSFLINLILKI
jgi:putative peptide zinc metalloprotease protein